MRYRTYRGCTRFIRTYRRSCYVCQHTDPPGEAVQTPWIPVIDKEHDMSRDQKSQRMEKKQALMTKKEKKAAKKVKEEVRPFLSGTTEKK